MSKNDRQSSVLRSVLIAVCSCVATLSIQRCMEPKPGLVYSSYISSAKSIMHPDSVLPFLYNYGDTSVEKAGNDKISFQQIYDFSRELPLRWIHIESDSLLGLALVSGPRAFLNQRVEKYWETNIRVENKGHGPVHRYSTIFIF